MFIFPHEEALRKIFFSFFFIFLLHPQLIPALSGLCDHCWPWQLSAAVSSSLSVSCWTLGVTSLGRGECLLLFKTESPLRLERATITQNSTIMWTSLNLWEFFACFQEKLIKSLVFFPPLYSTLKMYLSEYWLKSRSQDLKIKLLWTAKLLWTTWS